MALQTPLLGLLLLLLVGCAGHSTVSTKRPIRALLITGGCCHNYALQTFSLTNAIARHARVEWTVISEGGSGTRAEIALYNEPNWAQGFDVVVHNECFADTQSPDYIRRITRAHEAGVPAVAIHCAMHTYRAASIDEWRKFLGVTSRRHDHQSRYPVKKVAPEHPILKGMPEDWVSPKDELYVIEKMWPGATPLATSVSEADGKSYPVAWVNGFGKARVFGTTFGHSDATFQDPVFLEMLSRGFLWAVASDSLLDRHSAGPLGDRSLPRRSSGSLRVAEKPTSPKHLRGGAISPKAPRLQTRTAVDRH